MLFILVLIVFLIVILWKIYFKYNDFNFVAIITLFK